MKNAIMIVLGCFVSVPALGADAPAETHKYKAHGFSISALEQTSDAPVQQVVIMHLPPKDGFSPNVNVQVQVYAGTIKEFAEMTKAQMKQVNFTTLNEKVAGSSMTMEFLGEVLGRKMHFYSKAELGQGKVYLATGSALAANWDETSARLKACVDSLKADAGKPAPRP
jgi:hypothetical protein